ncbi:hypothetical protein L3Q82_023566 [Scortum barcoo]|uniref:Uncharacterized protein n=1 Tax=Scortum barcoo TaxID=214431 RepID=A0ACB8WUG7_9TELE|nr:hypothetical protein L3Q82_023566 [Scortum barcoo]
MEAMEVDSPVEVQGGGSGQPVVAVAAVDADVPHIISDSGSSTEVDEDDDSEERQTAARVPPRLPATWAFSQRAVSGAAAAPSSAHGAPIRRRLRQGLRVHYPSQTAAPSRGFPEFLLRAPAASVAEPESGSTTEASESDDEEEEEEEERDEEGAPAAAAPVDQAPPASPHLSASVQQAQDTTNSSSAADGERTETQNQVVQPVAVASASVQSSHGEEGEGDSCTICFEAWTTAGEHRLSALRCGHLFGFTCIQRWLKAQGAAAKCPQCNKKAKRSDIVLLYAPKLRALDNSEQESLKKSLEEEQSLRRKAELESAQYKLKLQVVTNKYGQAQQELQELRALMAQTGRSSIPSSSSSSASTSLLLGLSQRTDGSRMAQYSFSKAVLVSQAGGSRVLSYCEPLSCLLASQPSPHSTLVPGCGVKKVSVVNMKASQYVPIHSKQIRGLSFNRQNDSLLLSAALDNTIKLTRPTTRVNRWQWSCCWCLDNSNYVSRRPEQRLQCARLRHQRHQHTRPGAAAATLQVCQAQVKSGADGIILCGAVLPVSGGVSVLRPSITCMGGVQLVPLRRADRRLSGRRLFLGAGQRDDVPTARPAAGDRRAAPTSRWRRRADTVWSPTGQVSEPSDNRVCSAGETLNQQQLADRVSFPYKACYSPPPHPGRSNPSLRCVLMALNRPPQQDSSQLPTCSCSPVQTFSAGSSCKLLTKNAVFRRPDGGGTLICAGDEASNSTMVWDAGSGSLLQKLPADLPVLDISPFAVNGEHFLASLTEKMLKLYRWE